MLANLPAVADALRQDWSVSNQIADAIQANRDRVMRELKVDGVSRVNLPGGREATIRLMRQGKSASTR